MVPSKDSRREAVVSYSPPKLSQLIEGFFVEENGKAWAEGSVTLIETESEFILVDTGSPKCWDMLKERLAQKQLSEDSITIVVITHGHLDHCANLGRFVNATVYMDNDVFKKSGEYGISGKEVELCPQVSVLKMRGHTDNDLVVLVEGTDCGLVVVAGDLFEFDDDHSTWQQNSRYVEDHVKSREEIYKIADVIVPGHGALFVNHHKQK